MAVRIMIVDDSADMRKLFRLALDLDDELTVVGEADSGEHAVHVATRVHPDCIVLDWQMPGLTGPETVPLLKEVAPEATIVLFSNVYGPAAERKALESGADRFVEKQMNVDDLIATIHELHGVVPNS